MKSLLRPCKCNSLFFIITMYILYFIVAIVITSSSCPGICNFLSDNVNVFCIYCSHGNKFQWSRYNSLSFIITMYFVFYCSHGNNKFHWSRYKSPSFISMYFVFIVAMVTTSVTSPGIILYLL